MIHVYLDDYRKCPAGFVLARDAGECRQLIDLESIDILSLDYDLGWGMHTGLDVVRYIVQQGKYPKRIYFHTSSPSGRMAMYELLMANAPEGTVLYNGPMPQSLIEEIATN
jgi:hypothetical protein